MNKILLVLFMVCAGGVMVCPDVRSQDKVSVPWTGKFPVFSVAHRGFSGSAPENTLAAFKKAIEVGSDMIELDVLLSKDGEVVVIHDDTLNRTTNGRGKVSQFTLPELKNLEAGKLFGSRFPGERIPTLKEVLELSRGKIIVHIELKEGDLGPYTMADLADRAYREVERAGMLDQVLFGSFNLAAVDRIRQINPGLPVVVIHDKAWNTPQDASGGRPVALLSSSEKVLNHANLLKAHQQGMKVFVWTVNTEEQMERALALGVDGIITNYPDRLIQVLQKKFK